MLYIMKGLIAVLSALLTICNGYQILYMVVSMLKKPKKFYDESINRYAVLICARNEENVIGDLIDSIRKQNYPQDMIDIFVAADNCTDQTAKKASEKGAICFERYNKAFVGKGYALQFLLSKIKQKYGFDRYAGYFIMDADNLLHPDFIKEMNKTFNGGYKVITGYRNSKNYADNWLSAGSSLCFLKQARMVNRARMIMGISCSVSGTGFLISKDIIKKQDGWKQFLLTEDIEFTIEQVIAGEKIGYCETATIYDEQPVDIKTTWNQRLRWAKGYYQVFLCYWKNLLKRAVFLRDFSSYDMIMTLAPCSVLTVCSMVTGMLTFLYTVFTGGGIDMGFAQDTLMCIVAAVCSNYFIYFSIGLVTTITEWKQIECRDAKKIRYIFTYPIFMMIYLPISVVALVKKVEWKPIPHGVTKREAAFQK